MTEHPGVEISVNHYDFITLFLACKVPKEGEESEQNHKADKFDQLCRAFSTEKTDKFFPRIGEIVGVYLPIYGPIGRWVRGRVEEYIQEGTGWMYKVFLIDRGYYVTSQQSHLTQLTEPMKINPPPLAKRVGLYGVLPNARLDQNTSNLLTDFFNKGQIYLKEKLKILDFTFGDISVQDHNGKILSLTEHLVAKNLVKEVANFQAEAENFYGHFMNDSSASLPTYTEEKGDEPISHSSMKKGHEHSVKKSKDTGYLYKTNMENLEKESFCGDAKKEIEDCDNGANIKTNQKTIESECEVSNNSNVVEFRKEKREISEISHDSLKSSNNSSLNISNLAASSSCINDSKVSNDSNLSTTSLNSTLTKKQRVCNELKDRLKALEIIDRYSVGNVREEQISLSFQAKRKRVQEKLRQRIKDKISNSDVGERGVSTLCSQSVCSEDSNSSLPKPSERPTLASITTVPIEELEKQDDNFDYVDDCETQMFLSGIIKNTGVLIHTKDKMVRPVNSLTDCYPDGNINQVKEESTQSANITDKNEMEEQENEMEEQENEMEEQENEMEDQENEMEDQEKLRILSELNQHNHPFCWKKVIKPLHEPETIIHRIQQKDKDVIDERVFKWRNFIFKLIICYESWRAKKLSQAFEEVCELESMFDVRSNSEDYLFSKIKEALIHVIRSSKAFLLLELNKLTEAEQLVDLIVPYNHMKKEAKAGIHGIKAAMLMEYGHKGNVYALQEAKKAVKLDESCAEWFYYISKCMGKIRRVTRSHDLVDNTEVWNINKAVELDQRNAIYKVYLAQVLSEKAFRQFKNIEKKKRKSEAHNKLEETNTDAIQIIKEAAALSPNNAHILICCARGLMKFPRDMRDLKFINDCIEKARKLAPDNSMVLHAQALYHNRYDCDEELALEAYEKVASDNFEAAMDLVKLHFTLKSENIIEELEILANKFEQLDKIKLQEVYTQAGSYLLFIKKDIIGALKYFLKVISIDPNSFAMRSHKSIFLRMREPVNMFDVMLEELQTRTEWNSFLPEERQVLKEFRIKIAFHDSLPNEGKKRLTVREILDLSRSKLEQDDLYRNRGRLKIENKKWVGNKKASKKTKTKRRDSTSSISSVDSDYQRDSTVYGPRDFFLGDSRELFCEHVSFHSQTTRKSSSNISDSDENSNGSSLSLSVSICSSIDYLSDNNENLSENENH